ncbi:hypothetical protein BG842_21020 [Haladaptatus sp. W1]|uniref:helix-turn-helix transcriptional regulator n=1 Tax=Haladaptatus sp. W1 TaxID=1897478 RepID=UPI0008499C9C|nr:helix-turn-helix domain-containing protein [Haladaptatus sp. W1]ODR80099.1 hypothetical protein BG842_21020 [Haladaptatus sp. W1]
MTSHEYATFLAGSANRARVVTALHEDGKGTVGSLSDRLSMSRSTVHRTLRTFTEYGWTQRVDGTYRLTEAGELVLDAYETLIRTIEWVEEYEELLTHLDDADGTFPIHGTTCANMVSATKDDPYRATTYIIDALTETSADRIRCITPIVSPLFADAARRLLDRGARIELIVSEPSLESAVQRSAEQRPPDSVARFELYSVPEDLPFGVTILDGERVLVSAFDERGNLRACLDGKNPDFVEWATSTYETRRGESRRANVIPDL